MEVKQIMVIPRFVRRNGITVRAYALVIVAFASTALSLSTPHTAAAAINQIPVVGQPVADIVNALKDGLVKPLVQAITNVLPQPVDNAVQAPVNAAMKAVDPIIGESKSATKSQRSAATNKPVENKAQTTTPTGIAEPTSASQTTQQSTVEGLDSLKNLPLLANTITPLDNHHAVLGDMTQTLPAGKDSSTLIAAGTVLLTMALSFVGLIAMIIRSHIRLVVSGEHIFARKDLAQASTVIVGLLIVGSVSLYIILTK